MSIQVCLPSLVKYHKLLHQCKYKQYNDSLQNKYLTYHKAIVHAPLQICFIWVGVHNLQKVCNRDLMYNSFVIHYICQAVALPLPPKRSYAVEGVERMIIPPT